MPLICIEPSQAQEAGGGSGQNGGGAGQKEHMHTRTSTGSAFRSAMHCTVLFLFLVYSLWDTFPAVATPPKRTHTYIYTHGQVLAVFECILKLATRATNTLIITVTATIKFRPKNSQAECGKGFRSTKLDFWYSNKGHEETCLRSLRTYLLLVRRGVIKVSTQLDSHMYICALILYLVPLFKSSLEYNVTTMLFLS